MIFLRSVIFLTFTLVCGTAFAEDWNDMENQIIVKHNGVTIDLKNRTKGWDDIRLTTPIGNTGLDVRLWYKNKPGLHRYRAEFSKGFGGDAGFFKWWAKPAFMLNAGDGYDKPVAALYAGGYKSLTDKVSVYLDGSKWVKTADMSHSFAYYRYGVSYKVDPRMTISAGIIDKLDKNWDSYAQDLQLTFKYNIK
jgi:hypothetical protein